MGGSLVGRIAAVALTIGSMVCARIALAEDPCLKQVFGRYCLGGEVDPLLQSVPAPAVSQAAADSLALIFPDGENQLYVLAFSRRIYKVVRAYGVSTQLRFDDTYRLLREKYGPGEDRSQFPEYASTPAARLAAIRRGEGRAVHQWMPSPTWHIELSWTRELGISLSYVANALSASRAARIESGL
ncbi:hypothetical protein [Thiocystis violascens]|uniref:Uncharacterized protein n=1 Tax=Thiocystis violascens (strain ATCC 17096 / DSM 198 / 6111) TaxID=765911 RepID=I3YF63_THIV6|nr:hypothetical protein [Thiocystis violascens]AFL75631.1 hypothetical protein Thivi_3788 [Thiocystis violascens DSM 198]